MQTQKYIEITFDDGSKLVCASREEAEVMLDGYSAAEYREQEIEMTQEQYDALPDFDG